MRMARFGSLIFWGGAGLLAGVGMAILSILAFGLTVALVSPANAAGVRWPGPHQVQVLRVLDGDTVEVLWLSGPCGRGPCERSVSLIRVRGIDTPEVHECRGARRQSCAACPAELELGKQARAEAERLLVGMVAVRARDIGPDAYNGRHVARLEFTRGGWQDFGGWMAARGFAVTYDPVADRSFTKAKPWCTGGRPAASGDPPDPPDAGNPKPAVEVDP